MFHLASYFKNNHYTHSYHLSYMYLQKFKYINILSKPLFSDDDGRHCSLDIAHSNLIIPAPKQQPLSSRPPWSFLQRPKPCSWPPSLCSLPRWHSILHQFPRLHVAWHAPLHSVGRRVSRLSLLGLPPMLDPTPVQLPPANYWQLMEHHGHQGPLHSCVVDSRHCHFHCVEVRVVAVHCRALPRQKTPPKRPQRRSFVRITHHCLTRLAMFPWILTFVMERLLWRGKHTSFPNYYYLVSMQLWISHNFSKICIDLTCVMITSELTVVPNVDGEGGKYFVVYCSKFNCDPYSLHTHSHTHMTWNKQFVKILSSTEKPML